MISRCTKPFSRFSCVITHSCWYMPTGNFKFITQKLSSIYIGTKEYLFNCNKNKNPNKKINIFYIANKQIQSKLIRRKTPGNSNTSHHSPNPSNTYYTCSYANPHEFRTKQNTWLSITVSIMSLVSFERRGI